MSEPNPNAFVFECQGKTCYADPLKVRRVLLENTLGKCWGVVREIRKKNDAIKDARVKADLLEKELEGTPTTPEELIQIQAIQKDRAEGKAGTTPFDQLPRMFKLEGYQGQVAIYSNQVAELEGILANAAYAAFNLPPLDLDSGTGVTEFEAIEILRKYLEYAEGKGERLGS